MVAREGIELPARGFSGIFRGLRGLSINHLQRLADPLPGSPRHNPGTLNLSWSQSWAHARKTKRRQRWAQIGRRRRRLRDFDRALLTDELQRLYKGVDQISVGFMCLATNARLLIAAKRRVRRIGVIAVGPHASGLDAAAK